MTRPRLFCILFLVMLLAILSAPASIVHGQRGENVPRLDIVVLVDESSSMWMETDKSNHRQDAFNMLVDVYGANEVVAGDDVRISVIAYGSTEKTQLVIPFMDANTGTVEEIKAEFKEFQEANAAQADGSVGLGWTDALRALELAKEQFTDPENGHRQSHKPAIIILTDGKPETERINEGNPNFEVLFADYVNQLYDQATALSSDQNGPFYYDGVCPNPKEGWVPIYTVRLNEATELPERYDEIWTGLSEQNGGLPYDKPDPLFDAASVGAFYVSIFQTLTCTPPSLSGPLTAPIRQEFQVYDLYGAIKFTVIKENPDITVRIFRPGSTTSLTENDAGVLLNRSSLDDVWAIQRSEPWAGTWVVELDGSGEVIFDYTPYPDQLRIVKHLPEGDRVRACAPVDISLSIENSAGTPVTGEIESFTLSVQRPDGETVDLGILAPVSDLFNYRYGDGDEATCLDGRYNFGGTFLLKRGAGEVRWSHAMEATLDPFMSIILPPRDGTVRTSEPIDLVVDLMVGTRPADALAAANPPVTAQVLRNGRAVGAPIALSYEGTTPARMRGQIPAGTLIAGAYTLQFELDTPETRTVETTLVSFTVEEGVAAAELPTATVPVPTATTVPPVIAPTPPDTSWLLPTLGGGGFLLALLGGLWLFSRMPKMPGLVLTDPNGVDRYVKGGLGGRLRHRETFLSPQGESVQIEFTPTQDANGQDAIRATLLNAPPDSRYNFVQVYGRNGMEALDAPGQSAIIDSDIEHLMIGGERYDLRI